ncbi:MAG: permease-like cell division protein FtsX [Dysgonamonadaceae bacterium]|nr:permease-like cell division protein FtsX [Dysgonamonadaceae bacterium]MDD4728130.1 permease-like cell division protein FtsX [Dysgonamonadaceae bacterium]
MAKKHRINRLTLINAKITSIVSVTLVLLLMGLTVMTFFLGRGISSFVKENMSFNVMLTEDVSDSEINNLRKRLDAMPFVKSSLFISKEQAKEQLIEDLGEDPEELLGYNPATDCIEIYLHSNYANSDSLTFVSKQIKAQTNVDDLLYRQEALDLVNNNLTKISTILLVLSLILLFISFTLIRNTIRLSIYSKRFIINTMRLVGATNGFIRRPFIRRNIVDGIFSGLLANILIMGLLYYLGEQYADLRSILQTNDLIYVFASVIVLGIVISYLSTVFAVNHYLRMKTTHLYYV